VSSKSLLWRIASIQGGRTTEKRGEGGNSRRQKKGQTIITLENSWKADKTDASQTPKKCGWKERHSDKGVVENGNSKHSKGEKCGPGKKATWTTKRGRARLSPREKKLCSLRLPTGRGRKRELKEDYKGLKRGATRE